MTHSLRASFSSALHLPYLLCMMLIASLLSACGGGAGTVGLPTGQALFSNAPPSVVLAAAATTTFTVGGGTPTYSASSSNRDVATASMSGTTLTITAAGAGTATISVTDAAGATIGVPVTVNAAPAVPVIPPGSLFTTSSGSVTLAVGASNSFGIGGGTAPYAVSSSNAGVATANVSGSNFTISGVGAGSAEVVVTDARGTALTLAVTVGSTSAPVDLFTTAPNTVTVAVGAAGGYTIGGGKPAYAVTSSNAGVARVALSGSAFTITGVAAGSAQVVVVDADGKRIDIAVTVGASAAVLPLYLTAPDDVRIAVGSSATFSAGGGTPAYLVSSSNTAVARVGINGADFIITGVAPGTAQVAVFDSKGDSQKIIVTIGSGGTATALYTSASSSLVLGTGVTESFDIGGGSAPYSASSSNAAVVTASVTGRVVSITGVANGVAQVTVTDNVGASIAIAVTVGSGVNQTELFTTAPGSVTVGINASSSYTIAGGTAPYSVGTSNAAVVTAAISGNGLTISGQAPGTAQLVIRDATGASVSVAVTVGSGSTSALYTTAPSAVTIATGASGVYNIGGGAGGYLATSSDASVVTVAISGNTLTLTPVGAGSASVQVFDATGASVTISVTITQVQPGTLTAQPEAASGNVGDSLVILVRGGTPGYTITLSNTSIATVSPSTVAASGGSFTLSLQNVGTTVATITDAAGRITSVPVTVSQTSTVLRLSPNALLIAELNSEVIPLNIYGGTGPFRVFTSDENLTAVTVNGAVMSVAVGRNGNRCINPVTESGSYIPNGTFDVTLTAVDSLGASATAVLTIKDNGLGFGVGCP